MVHAKQVEDSRLRKKNWEANKERSFESSSVKVGLICKKSLSLRRGFQIKFLLISLLMFMHCLMQVLLFLFYTFGS